MADNKHSDHLWSADVKTNWHPPVGFFEREPQFIAEGLKVVSDSHAQAVDRLNFYINRAGSKLDESSKKRLEKARSILENLYNN